jgi:hypothetical protein
MPEAKSKSKVDDQGLIEDRDSDSEFDPERDGKPAQEWDDEENFIRPDDAVSVKS